MVQWVGMWGLIQKVAGSHPRAGEVMSPLGPWNRPLNPSCPRDWLNLLSQLYITSLWIKAAIKKINRKYYKRWVLLTNKPGHLHGFKKSQMNWKGHRCKLTTENQIQIRVVDKQLFPHSLWLDCIGMLNVEFKVAFLTIYLENKCLWELLVAISMATVVSHVHRGHFGYIQRSIISEVLDGEIRSLHGNGKISCG